jgi:DNA-binding helix-hairpin-helix protein with protein kinase domain
MMGVNLTVESKLGEGGQGIVYAVTYPKGTYALKWYIGEQATSEQASAIRTLVLDGPPKGPAGRRFVWPQDLATSTDSPAFGYLMPLIDMKRFAELEEVQAHLKPAPAYPSLCEICYQAANSYRALHLTGRCYRDVSARNVLFDPKTGDVLICDNDNVGVNRQSKSPIWGTMEFMAPELVRQEADPSTETDLHSLAVLLFNLWVWHHPLHGEMEYQFRNWDQVAKKKVYGKDPVFVFDPKDRRNQLPGDPAYVGAGKRWAQCPTALKDLFVKAFTVGLTEPGRRVTEGEWQSLFLQLKDGVISCSHCKAENIWNVNMMALNCWHCGKTTAIPPRLVISHPGGKHFVLLSKGAKLFKRHIDQAAAEDALMVLGEVVQNPANPQIWGIKNLTKTPWTGTLPDGSTKEYVPQKAVPLNPGIKLNIGGTTAEIQI